MALSTFPASTVVTASACAATLVPYDWWTETDDAPQEATEFQDQLEHAALQRGIRIAAWTDIEWPQAGRFRLLLIHCARSREESAEIAHDISSSTEVGHRDAPESYYAMVETNAFKALMSDVTRDELIDIAADNSLDPCEELLFLEHMFLLVLRDVKNHHDMECKCCGLGRLEGLPELWAIHDDTCNRAVWETCSGGRLVLDRCGPAEYLFHFLIFELSEEKVQMYDSIAASFGIAVGVYAVFCMNAVQCILVLVFITIPFIVWQGMGRHWDGVGRPLFALLLCLWLAHVKSRWSAIYTAIKERWHLEELMDTHGSFKDRKEPSRPEFFARPPGSDHYPASLRTFRTILMLPLLALNWLIVACMLGFTFWVEMWIVYEWAGCHEMNKASREAKCNGAHVNKGAAGAILEAVPGLFEGILFQLAKVFAQQFAQIACRFQNWRTNTQYMHAYALQVYILEFISKFMTIATIAFAFVPEWDGIRFEDEDGVKEWYEVTEEDCNQRYLLGKLSPSCVRVRTPAVLRLKLLEGCMVGCFVVGPIVGSLISNLVPSIIKKCIHGRGLKCFLGRLLGFIFYFDSDAVGGPSFIFHGSLPQLLLDEDCPPIPGFDSAITWPEVLEQGLQQEFDVVSQYIELTLHLNFIATFAVVWPMGVVFSLLICLFDFRGDIFALTHHTRRPFCHVRESLCHSLWVKDLMRFQLVICPAFSSALLVLPYKLLAEYFPSFQSSTLQGYASEAILAVICMTAIVSMIMKFSGSHWSPLPKLPFMKEYRGVKMRRRLDTNHWLRRDTDELRKNYSSLQAEVAELRRGLAETRKTLGSTTSTPVNIPSKIGKEIEQDAQDVPVVGSPRFLWESKMEKAAEAYMSDHKTSQKNCFP